MMNEDSKKRLKAMAEAVAKLMKEQDEQKARKLPIWFTRRQLF